MPAELQTMLVLLPVACLGSFVYGVTGFGSALITIPLASLIYPLQFVLAVFALAGLLSPPAVWRAAAPLVPAILGALWLADRAHSRISRMAMIRGIRVLLLIAGMSLVVRAIHGM